MDLLSWAVEQISYIEEIPGAFRLFLSASVKF